VDFSTNSYSVDESAGTATITVTLSAASGVTATVDYATSDNTATAGSDYTTASGTLTFSPGITQMTFTIPITNDTLFEGNETLTLTLSNPVSATLAGVNNPASLTIIDNDASTVDFSTNSYSVDEGVGIATITVTLSAASSVTATVDYATSDNTAIAGSDYTTASGTLTFTPGITELTFTVLITDDGSIEGNETLTLTLSNAISATLGSANNPAALTIVDNDIPPAKPTLIAPADGTFTNTQTITFIWSRVSQAVTYTLHLSGSTFDIPDPGSGTTVVSPTFLAEGVYTWTVEAINSSGLPSGLTATWQVTVDITPPTAPTLISPTNGISVSTGQPTFDWSDSPDALSGPVTYTIIITNSSGTPSIYNTTASVFTPSTSLPSGVYTWTVLAYDRAGNSIISPQVFTVSIESTIGDVYLPIILRNYTPGVIIPRPDLVVTNITVTPNGGGDYTVQVTVLNQSAVPVTYGNNFHVHVYLNGDYSNHVISWGLQGSWFGAGQSRVLTTNYTFPGSGTYSLNAWADPFNVVIESDDSNNTFTLPGVVISGLAGEVAPQSDSLLPSGPLPTPTLTP
jgi:hypothetical protein